MCSVQCATCSENPPPPHECGQSNLAKIANGRRCRRRRSSLIAFCPALLHWSFGFNETAATTLGLWTAVRMRN